MSSASTSRAEVVDVDASEATAAAGLLTDAEAAAGGEVVDESERRRLDAFAADPDDRAAGWQPVLARHQARAVGYGAMVVGDGTGTTATGDVAVHPHAADPEAVLTALLDAIAERATTAGTDDLEVWCRRVGQREIDTAEDAGFTVHRRLGVLGRALPVTSPAPPSPDDVTLRASRPGDDDAIVAVLAAAYADTPEAGWDLDRFTRRRRLDWFRAEDLLVAEDAAGRHADPALLGLHWLKRRGDGVGEVHNLAVHPVARGRRLGPLLLRAGLDHLSAVGCHEVILWVDRANARAVHLYTGQGFTTRWDDVALRRDPQASTGPRP